MRPFLSYACRAACYLTIGFLLSPLPIGAQVINTQPIAINTGNNQGVSMEPLKQQTVDTAPLTILAKHLNAVHAGSWTALQASGSIQLGGSTAPFLPATLAIRGVDEAQLTIQGGTKLKSIVADGSVVTMANADGTSSTFGDQIGSLGLLQFQWLRASTLSSRMAGLRDAGLVVIQGKQLQKLELLFLPKSAALASKKVTTTPVQVDLYFDPSTYLLDRVASPVRLPGMRNTVLQVTEYGNYESVSGTMIPFSIKESIDGQPQWSLSLTEASLPATIPTSLL